MIMFFTPGCNTCMLDNHWGKHWDCCEGNVLNVFFCIFVWLFLYICGTYFWNLNCGSYQWISAFSPDPFFLCFGLDGHPFISVCTVLCTLSCVFMATCCLCFYVSVCAYQYLKCNIQHTVCLCTTQCACVHQYGHPFISTISPAPPPPISHFIFL